MTARRRVLVSAFACSPDVGSEPGVGWHWATEIARRHDVLVVTRGAYRGAIEAALSAAPVPGLRFLYFEPSWHLGIAAGRRMFSRRYYLWWQWCVRHEIGNALRREAFDLFHHLTWGTFRFPSFLGHRQIPIAMGPVGGGERAPLALLEGLPWRSRLFDWLRDATLRVSGSEWLAPRVLRRSSVVLCKTAETRRALPASVRPRAVVTPEIGAPDAPAGSARGARSVDAPLALLFAGRLLGWKGSALAVGAVQRLVARGHDVTLDVAGVGPLAPYLQTQIDRLGLGSRVRLLGQLPMAELLRLYGRSDVFLFPSLHDSSGSVVLEALSRGLPVVCLDLGGPPTYIDSGCGIAVATGQRSRAEVECGLADAVERLIAQPDRLREMSDSACRRAAEATWRSRVEHAYRQVEQRLGWTEASGAHAGQGLRDGQ